MISNGNLIHVHRSPSKTLVLCWYEFNHDVGDPQPGVVLHDVSSVLKRIYTQWELLAELNIVNVMAE